MASEEVVIKVRALKKYFDIKKGFFSGMSKTMYVKALDGVDFEIHKGEILGLVGESGCGKTTTGRLLTRLEDPTEGNVFFLGRDIAPLRGADLRTFRRNIQMVFQDPYESLNPRTTVLQTVLEPLINHNIGKTQEERIEIVIKALEDAGLAPAKEYLERFPHELSGGQRQRVSIARALVMSPRVIVADEPVSMLDVSIRAGVLNLMLDLRDKYHIPYLFITHDIAVARYVSDTLAVMYLGRIVEVAETDTVIQTPKHPYTQALLSAVPVPDPEHKHGRIRIKGEIPSAIDVPLGCRFRPRCPLHFESCGWEAKELIEYLTEEEKVYDPGHALAGTLGELEADGFTMLAHIKEGGDPAKVVGFLKGKVDQQKATNPMFKAIISVESARSDKSVEVKCSSVETSPEAVARELMSTLITEIDFRNPSHPVHGTITEIKTSGERLIVETGPDKAETAGALLTDFVDRRKRTDHPEFRGVASIEPDVAQNHVDILFKAGKMSRSKVMDEVRDMIERDVDRNPRSTFANSVLPMTIGRSAINVRIAGGEDRYGELRSELMGYFEKQVRAGDVVAKGVTGIEVTSGKAKGGLVMVKFRRIGIPPDFPVGQGHTAACYLYGPPVE